MKKEKSAPVKPEGKCECGHTDSAHPMVPRFSSIEAHFGSCNVCFCKRFTPTTSPPNEGWEKEIREWCEKHHIRHFSCDAEIKEMTLFIFSILASQEARLQKDSYIAQVGAYEKGLEIARIENEVIEEKALTTERARLAREFEKMKLPLNDENTPEEAELMTRIYGNAKTPEYMRERRYGGNLIVERILALIKEPPQENK